jgi:hypothetical protein
MIWREISDLIGKMNLIAMMMMISKLVNTPGSWNMSKKGVQTKVYFIVFNSSKLLEINDDSLF